MSTKLNYVQLPKVMNTVELEQRKSEAKDKVLTGTYVETRSGGYFTHPASITESFNDPLAFLEYVSSQAKADVSLYPNIEPVMTGAFFQIAYYLPATELQALVDQAEQEAEQTYKVEIESFNQAQTDLLTNQLVEAELSKIKKKEDQALQAIRDKAAATAQQHITAQLKDIK